MTTQHPVAPSPAPRIEGFEVLERIGRGPRAEVWRARTPLGGKDIAVKVFALHVTRRPSFTTLFEKETAALMSLTHPNMLGALDRGRSGERYYLASTWMPQGSLRAAMGAGRIPLPRAMRVALGVCDALEYAHRRGLPHRHLVPENIFVDRDDRVLVSDFGLSRLHDATLSLNDARADLQALAATLYELVCGAPVLPADSAPPSSAGPAVPSRLDKLFGRAFAPVVADRFSRAGELSLALRLALSDSVPAPPPPDDAPDELSRRNKVLTVTPFAAVTTRALSRLEKALEERGPWSIGYDLAALSDFNEGLTAQIRRLHTQHHRNITSVAFCSQRPLVRGTALVLGGSIRHFPSKIFSSRDLMQRWLEGPAS